MLNVFWIKLSSGESIICRTEDDINGLYEKAIVPIIDPMTIQQSRLMVNGGLVETYSMMPWDNFSEDGVFNLIGDHIILAAEPSAKMQKLYEETLDKNSEEYDETSDDLDMAQQLLRALQESYDDEDDDEDQEETRRRPARIFH